MGPQGAVDIPYRDELDTADDPSTRHNELIEEHHKKPANPYTTVDHGFIDDIIEPGEIRGRLIPGLRMLSSRHKSQPDKGHGNILL